jgi:hypothetical protein
VTWSCPRSDGSAWIDPEGSTTAKQLAKEAIQNFNNTPTEIAWSPTLLKANVRSNLLEVWQKDWSICTTGSLTRQFFPRHKDAACLKNKFIQHEVTQVLTGHCQLKQHLHKIGKSSSPLLNAERKKKQSSTFSSNARVLLSTELS